MAMAPAHVIDSEKELSDALYKLDDAFFTIHRLDKKHWIDIVVESVTRYSELYLNEDCYKRLRSAVKRQEDNQGFDGYEPGE